MVARVLVIASLIVGLLGVARADDKPWAAGVSAENQAKALEIYRAGNTYFEHSQFKEALAKYQEALALWDHPAIRYNAAVCLINLDRPAEAYEHFESALRFGARPLGTELFDQGQTYEQRLERSLGQIEVSCTERDARVQLDGRPLLTCPGSATRRLGIGDHVIVATKPGFETLTRPIALQAGNKLVVPVELRRAATGTLKRRFRPWLPWSIAIGGAAVAVAGGFELAIASSLYDHYDTRIVAVCPTGCAGTDPRALGEQPRRDRADRDKNLGRGMLAVGGVAIATGLVMVVLNQGKVERAPMIAPAVAPDHVGLVISGRW